MAGHSCSQSMVMGYADQFNLSQDTAARLASGFAGGLAQGKTCGAVTGAIMVVGLKYGPKSLKDAYGKDHCYQVTQEFCHRFKILRKTIECFDILKMNKIDPGNPDTMKNLRGTGLCAHIVTDAQEILDELLMKEDKT